MNKIITILAVFAFGAIHVSGSPEQIKTVQSDVTIIIHAVYDSDHETALRFTHPKILEMMGGKEKVTEALKEAFSTFEALDMSIESLAFPEAPRFFAGKENVYVTVPTLTIMVANGKRVESLNFQFGIRKQDEEEWTYIEGSRVTKESLKQLFSDIPESIELPPFYRKLK